MRPMIRLNVIVITLHEIKLNVIKVLQMYALAKLNKTVFNVKSDLNKIKLVYKYIILYDCYVLKIQFDRFPIFNYFSPVNIKYTKVSITY